MLKRTGAVCLLILLMTVSLPVKAAYKYDCSQNRHEYKVEIITAAAKERDGLRRYTCVRCGKVCEEPIPMYGHDFGEWITEQEPTCQKEGIKRRYCIRRFHKEFYEEAAIPVTNHVYGDWKEVKKAAKDHDGLRIRQCKYGCGTSQKEPIPAGAKVSRQGGVWTMADVILVGSSVLICLIFGILIYRDARVLLWFRRMQQKTLWKWKNGESLYGG